jgi:hypothetical protein
MTISRDLIIDIVLNVSGYVAAGALWLVLRSLFRRSRKHSSTEPTTKKAPADAKAEAPRGEGSSEKRRLEFVDLTGFDSTSGRISRAAEAAERQDARNFRRNRAEVMRMAREMLNAGSPRDRIRQTLPISEGELAMLTRE